MVSSSMEKTRSNQSVTTTHVKETYWVKTEKPVRAWWPGGIIPLIGLGLLSTWAFCGTAKEVDAHVQENSQRLIHANNMTNVKTNVSGQHLELNGTVANQEQKRQAELLAKTTECSTMMGDKVCPVHVKNNLKIAGAAAAVAAPVAAVAGRFHPFTFTQNEKSLVLNGEVSTQDIKRDIVAHAQTTHNNVVDKMTVSNDAGVGADKEAAIHSLNLASTTIRSKGVWKEGVFSFTALANADKEAQITNSFQGAQNGIGQGELKITVAERLNECETGIADLLQKNTIKFQTGKANIAASSMPGLKKLAEYAAQCPGRFAVEGHTDNVGNPEKNMDLSQRRAGAVLSALGKYGMNTENLEAKGYGDTAPKAPNDSAQGRAQNRRIEIKVLF